MSYSCWNSGCCKEKSWGRQKIWVRSSDTLSCWQGIGLILYDAREGSTKASRSGVSSIQKEIQNLIKMAAGASELTEVPGTCQAARMSEYSYKGGPGRNTSWEGRTFLVNFKGRGDNYFFFKEIFIYLLYFISDCVRSWLRRAGFACSVWDLSLQRRLLSSWGTHRISPGILVPQPGISNPIPMFRKVDS